MNGIMTIETTVETMTPYTCLVAEARAELTPPPGAFTAVQFARDAGIAQNTALRRLNRMVAEGTLNYREYVVNSHRTRYFWFEDGNV